MVTFGIKNNEKNRRLNNEKNHINNQKIRLEENTRFHKDKLKEIEENIKKSFRMHPTQMEKEFDGDNKNGSETRELKWKKAKPLIENGGWRRI